MVQFITTNLGLIAGSVVVALLGGFFKLLK